MKDLQSLMEEYRRHIRKSRARKRLYYFLWMAPAVLVYVLGIVIGSEFVKWVGTLTVAAGLGSVIATEITLFQVENLGFGAGMLFGFLQSPLGKECAKAGEKVFKLLEEINPEEVEEFLKNARELLVEGRDWWRNKGRVLIEEALEAFKRSTERGVNVKFELGKLKDEE